MTSHHHKSNTYFAQPHCLSISSHSKPWSASISDSFAFDIDEKLKEAEKERMIIRDEIKISEDKIQSGDISICYAD